MKLSDLKNGERFRTYSTASDCVKIGGLSVFFERDKTTRTLSADTAVQAPLFPGRFVSNSRLERLRKVSRLGGK